MMNWLSTFFMHAARLAMAVWLALFAMPAFALAGVSVSVQSLAPSTSISVGQNVSFTISASGFTNPSYSLSDSFGGSSASSGNINNSSGSFSWTPGTSDAGTHNFTITVSDSWGNSASIVQSISVGSNNPAIQGLSPGQSVPIGKTLTFTLAAPGFTTPSFSLSDSFSGSTVSNADINSAGYFSWTPGNSDIGTHNMTLYVNDPSGHSGNIPLAITVSTPSIAIVTLNPGTVVAPGNQLTMSVSQQGFTTPTYTVSDSFSPTSVSNADIDSSGNFAWTPDASQVGAHTLTMYATDSLGHSANTAITVDVNAAPTQVVPTTTTTTTTTAAATTSSASTLSSLQAELAQYEAQIAALSSGGPSSSVSSGFTFQNYLYPGVTSDDVTELQTILAQQGYFSGTPTGYYGDATENAVIAFQAARGLDQLGVVGPATRAALNTILASGSSASSSASSSSGDGYVFQNFIGYGDTSTDVTELQQRLATLGFFSGTATGYFGDQTQAAVEQFQSAHGISQVGYVGPATRAALNGQ